MRSRLAACLGLLTVFTSAACTDIPSSSSPDRIESVAPASDSADAQSGGPQPNEPPRNIVLDFLKANATSDPQYRVAQKFLAPNAQSTWHPNSTVTVIADKSIGEYDGDTKTVTVKGRPIGTLLPNGVYTPTPAALQGLGSGSVQQYEFTIQNVAGQNRIAKLPGGLPGLLIDYDEFRAYFSEHPLYYFDLTTRYLVPDLRWSALTGLALERWLLAQLVALPRPELAGAVDSDTFPVGTQSVTPPGPSNGGKLSIEVQGLSQLDAAGKNRVGAQVVETMDSAAPNSLMTITDGGKPVTIPLVKAKQFTVEDFTRAEPTPPAGDVYYLRNGTVVTATGKPLPGFETTFRLASVALAQRAAALRIAGVIGTGAAAQLVAGSRSSGLALATGVPKGVTSRPAWAPGIAEVWVGVGGSIYRYLPDEHKALVVSAPSIQKGGVVRSLRLSAEGSRVSVVVAANGTQQLYVGSVVRTGNDDTQSGVRIDQLTRVSPSGLVIVDAAWIEPTRLFCVGYDQGTLNSDIYEVNVDGSVADRHGIGNLSGGPDSVTVAAGNLAWVSVGNSVYTQDGSDWDSPGPTAFTDGTNPVYLE